MVGVFAFARQLRRIRVWIAPKATRFDLPLIANEELGMTTAQIIDLDGTQAVRLPEEFRFAAPTVSIRKDGQAVVLEPLKTAAWPPGFFEGICISDPAFARPPQGETPPAPMLN